MSDMKEPYEDPSLDPSFVRSTKEYLKQANQHSVIREIKQEQEAVLKNLDKVSVDDPGM